MTQVPTTYACITRVVNKCSSGITGNGIGDFSSTVTLFANCISSIGHNFHHISHNASTSRSSDFKMLYKYCIIIIIIVVSSFF